MSRLIPLSLFLLALLPVPSFAAEFTADSALRAVTVYTNRAALTRRAVVDIPAGAHTVVFENLPANLMPDSLRAEGEAEASVTFGAVSYKMVASAELAQIRERELAAQIEKLQDQLDAVQAEKNALLSQKSFLENLGKQAVMRANENIAVIDLKPAEWSAAAQALRTELSAVLKAVQAQDIAARDIEEEIQKLNTEMGQLYTGERNTYEVALPVEARVATKLTVDLSYQVPEATWQPLYDARLDTKTGKLELIQYGAVRQNTGEDWEGIALTLSTAQPHRGASLPDPQPLWISLYEHVPMASKRAQREMLDSSVASQAYAVNQMPAEADMMMAEAGAAPPVPDMVAASFTTAEIDTGGFVSEYRIPGPSTVMADGTESKLMIGPFPVEGKMQIRIQPQVSSDAYLAAMATLKGDAPVLPGRVNLFRDGAFVGQMDLPLLRPDQKRYLYFGIDDQFSVRRRVMKDEKGEAGVIAKDQVLERHYLTEIQNLHNTAFDVVVLELTPVSQDERIRSEIVTAATTQGYTADPDNIKGLLRWMMKMEPKEKKEIKLGVKVSWPAGMQMNGY